MVSSVEIDAASAPFEWMLASATRNIFFTGKGGVGKTTIACSTAVALADSGRRVLIVSTDPASNLSDVLGYPVAPQAGALPGVDGLFVLDLDPDAAARSYRERVVGPYRGVLPDSVVASMEEQLSGACTVEIAAFDEFTALLADPEALALYDHVVFDTAPTGHTLRLLSLPGAWTDYMDASTTGATCLGPLSGLERQREMYQTAIEVLSDARQTTIFLVSRPERASLLECERTREELVALGFENLRLVLNGVFAPAGSGDSTALALAARGSAALQEMPSGLTRMAKLSLPLRQDSPSGVDALRSMARPVASAPGSAVMGREQGLSGDLEQTAGLRALIDDIEAAGHGIVMAMGKGGVGKTTVAAAIAVELARRGHPVHLTTTDPAAHIVDALGPEASGGGTNDEAGRLRVSRIDPVAEVAAYADLVISEAGEGLDANGIALLKEDLRSPCTEEIAVFRAFSHLVAEGREGFLILDTAPTGHTMMLLEAADAYSKEIARVGDPRGLSEEVLGLLGTLRDPAHTRVMIVTLLEPTPVFEAERLQDDLIRAGITPRAWIINQSLSRTGSTHPILAERARAEARMISRVTESAIARDQQVAILSWVPVEPRGREGLLALVST